MRAIAYLWRVAAESFFYPVLSSVYDGPKFRIL